MCRGSANFEDDLRTAIELLKGIKILKNTNAKLLEDEINEKMKSFILALLKNESKKESTQYISHILNYLEISQRQYADPILFL